MLIPNTYCGITSYNHQTTASFWPLLLPSIKYQLWSTSVYKQFWTSNHRLLLIIVNREQWSATVLTMISHRWIIINEALANHISIYHKPTIASKKSFTINQNMKSQSSTHHLLISIIHLHDPSHHPGSISSTQITAPSPHLQPRHHSPGWGRSPATGTPLRPCCRWWPHCRCRGTRIPGATSLEWREPAARLHRVYIYIYHTCNRGIVTNSWVYTASEHFECYQ